MTTAPKWKTGSEHLFVGALDDERILEVNNNLTEMALNVENVSQIAIDSVTCEVSKIMSQAADSLGMIHPQKAKPRNLEPQGKHVNNNPHSNNAWLSDESKKHRAVFRRLKRWDKASGGCDEINKAKNAAYKVYKKSLSRNYNSYVKDIQNKIRKLKTTDTSSYWRLINGDKQQKQYIMDNISREVFANHFEKLSNAPEECLIDTSFSCDDQIQNDMLEATISQEEVMKCMLRLKNNKACGYDGILNEFLKFSCPKLVETVTALFNLILDSGKLPNDWAIGYISPIYKGKGSAEDPDNYRGITIVSCFGKLFTSILNQRICAFLEANNLLGSEQAGFRKGHSTLDHIFTLHCLIDVYLRKKKKLFCAFIDYRKAFDSIQHGLLWEKLINMNIGGKVLNIIRDMYSKTKLCVKHMRTFSHFFYLKCGAFAGGKSVTDHVLYVFK